MKGMYVYEYYGCLLCVMSLCIMSVITEDKSFIGKRGHFGKVSAFLEGYGQFISKKWLLFALGANSEAMIRMNVT